MFNYNEPCAAKEKKPCGFGMKCFKKGCPFGHPLGYSLAKARSQHLCRNGPNCSNDRCGFAHPDRCCDRKKEFMKLCWNGSVCMNRRCSFIHPDDWPYHEKSREPSAESSRPGTPPLVAKVYPDENTCRRDYAKWLSGSGSGSDSFPLTHALLSSLASKLGLKLKSGVVSLCYVRSQLLLQLHPDKHDSGMTDVIKGVHESVRKDLLQRVYSS